MATIKDVASHCGVSVSLVSKALNGYDDVKPETKALILKSVEELGYVANASASSLSRKNQNKLAVIIRGYNNAKTDYFVDEIAYIYANSTFKRALELNLDTVVIFDDVLKGKSDVEITNYLKSNGVTGVILFGISKDDDELYSIYKNDNFKKVVLDIPLINNTTSSISINDIKAQSELLKTSIPNESNRVIFLAGPENNITSAQRLSATKSFCHLNNIELDIIYCDYDMVKAYEATFNINLNLYDAIICANDMMAIGCSKALKELSVTKLVTGFDGIKLLDVFDYNIKSIKQDFEYKSTQAVDELKRLLEGHEPSQIFLEYTIYDKNNSLFNNTKQ